MTFRLMQVSDTHLSAQRSYFVGNFEAVLASANATRPDLVVGTGDLALDDPDDEGDADFARACFERVRPRWRVLPGNHDVGDSEPDPWLGQPVTADRRERWLQRWGPDWWVEEAEDWVVVGLDSLLFASELAAEHEQWDWLSGVTTSAGERPVMLMLHKPLCLWDPDEEVLDQSSVTPAGRRRLLDALGGARVRLVASGHVHQHREWSADGLTMIWAPSSAFVSASERPSAYGATKLVGAVQYRFDGRAVAWSMVRPAGMVDHDVKLIGAGVESLRWAPPLPV